MVNSPYPITVSIPNATIFDLLAETANRCPKLTALDFLGETVSYRHFLENVMSVASYLTRRGISVGDRVLLALPNVPQALYLLYAVNRIGAVAVMMHPTSSKTEISQANASLKCRLVITADTLPIAFEKSCQVPNVDTDGKSPALILYSGGTCGQNKPVVLSNDNVNASAIQTLSVCGSADITGRSILSLMPLFHGFGLCVGVHLALISGAYCVLLPKMNGQALADAIARTRLNYLPGVPSFFAKCLLLPELSNVDFSHLKGVFCGGDDLRDDLQKSVQDFLHQHGCDVPIRCGYGLTEAVSVVSLTPALATGDGDIGFPLPNVACKIVEPNSDREVPIGSIGELCLSGPCVMSGYLNQYNTDAFVFHQDEDGVSWLHTGDLCCQSEDGRLRFVQRWKRMIITNGYNVYPTELEKRLLEIKGVREACVLGTEDAVRGQAVVAFVAGDRITQDEILNHLKTCVPLYAIPQRVVISAELPKTEVGKVNLLETARQVID